MKFLHKLVINQTEKGILIVFFVDTVQKFIYYQLCKIQQISCQERDFISN